MPSARPLRSWLALRFALAGMLPLAVVAALVLLVLLPQMRVSIEIQHQALARAIAGQIESHLLGAGRELRAIAEHIRNQGNQPASFWLSLLDAHAGTGDVFAAIYIADVDDAVCAVGLPQARRGQRSDLLGLDLSKLAVVREARERNREVWSETFLSTGSGRLAVTLAIPVAGQVLIGEIAIDQLSEFIGRLPLEPGMLEMILDRQGQIIAHSQHALSGQQLNLSHLPIVRDALRKPLTTHGFDFDFDGETVIETYPAGDPAVQPVQDFEFDGETLIGTVVRVPQLGWMVLVAQPRIEAFQPFLGTLWVLAVGAIIALLLAMAATLVLARGLSQHIRRYTEQAHAIADGDYDQPWPVSPIREFANLAGDLERMAHAIRQRERDLATSEARQRAIMENLPHLVWLKDTQGRFLMLNHLFAQACGRKHIGEVIGKTDLDVWPRNLAEQYRADDREIMRLRRGQSIEEMVADQGVIKWFETFKTPVIDAEGQLLGTTGFARDITERMRAEEELRQHREHLEELVTERTAELQRTNAELHQAMAQLVQAEKLAALGSLVAGVAHELNTPLGNARVVASALGEDLRAFAVAVESGSLRRSQLETFLGRGREAIELLERNTVRAADLIGHFKQVAVDQTSMRRRRFNLRQTIEEMLVTLRPQFKRTAHRIELEIPPDLELDSYPGPLEQALANLVSNSLIHGFAGLDAGVIHIRAAASDAGRVQIDYADNGVGIPEPMLKRIFDPFFTTRLGSGGSGLGLYIVYNLMTGVLGGTIQASSRPGSGATFTLALPLTAPDRPILENPHER